MVYRREGARVTATAAAYIDHDDKGYVQDPCDGVLGGSTRFLAKKAYRFENSGKSKGRYRYTNRVRLPMTAHTFPFNVPTAGRLCLSRSIHLMLF
jgi:hypothetical protein